MPKTRYFLDYFADDIGLEDRLNRAFEELAIKSDHRHDIEAFLEPLKVKHLPSWEHSVRVGLLCWQIAKLMHLDQKAMFFPGILHDVGKAQVELATLTKTIGWTGHDTALMKKHSRLSYELIRDKFDFSAEVVLWHHNFQQDGYPKIHPLPLHDYGLGTRAMIPFYGRLLALADFYDALHRVNDKFRITDATAGEAIKHLMLENNKDQLYLINEFYEAGVFSTYIRP